MRISDWSSDVCSSDLLYINPDARGSGSSGFRRRFAFRLDDLALLALVQLWRRIAFDEARQRASLPAHDDAAEPVEGVRPTRFKADGLGERQISARSYERAAIPLPMLVLDIDRIATGIAPVADATMVDEGNRRFGGGRRLLRPTRSEEHTSELQSLMRISYAGFCLKKKNITTKHIATR